MVAQVADRGHSLEVDVLQDVALDFGLPLPNLSFLIVGGISRFDGPKIEGLLVGLVVYEFLLSFLLFAGEVEVIDLGLFFHFFEVALLYLSDLLLYFLVNLLI